MAIQIQLRRDTAANWTAADTVLAEGELGIETDTAKVKIGDGVTAWAALDYTDAGLTAHIADSTDPHGANITLTGDIQATTANLAGMDISNDGTKTTLLGTAGNYNRIGDAGVTGHSFDSEDDLLITGDLEVNGTTYLDGNTYTNVLDIQNNRIQWNDLGNISTRLVSSTSFDEFLLETTDYLGLQFVIGKYSGSTIKDYDHVAQSNPTLFIHSATDPDSDNTQWISITHDQTDGKIETGKGDLFLSPAGGEVKFGTYTAGAAVTSTGYITIIDKDGNTRKLMVQA